MKITDIHFYGLGAIGSNLLIQLSKQFSDLKFYGLDMDKVEARNIGPQAYFLEHIGNYKAIAMNGIMRRFQRNPNYAGVTKKLTEPIYLNSATTLVLDCFDNTASRKLLLNTGSPTFHIGFSPLYTAEGIWSPGYDVPNDVPQNAPDLCTLPDATSFIHYVVNTAALAITEFLLEGRKRDFIVTKTQSRIPQVRLL